MPAGLTAEEKAKPAKMKMWEMRLKRYSDREETLSENMRRLHGIIIGQCAPSLQSIIKTNKKYNKKSKNFDSL